MIDQQLKGVVDLAGVAQVVVGDQRDQRHRRGAVPTEHALTRVGEHKLMTLDKLQYCCVACTERSRGGADRAKEPPDDQPMNVGGRISSAQRVW